MENVFLRIIGAMAEMIVKMEVMNIDATLYALMGKNIEGHKCLWTPLQMSH